MKLLLSILLLISTAAAAQTYHPIQITDSFIPKFKTIVYADSAYDLHAVYYDTTYPISYAHQSHDTVYVYDHVEYLEDKCIKIRQKYYRLLQREGAKQNSSFEKMVHYRDIVQYYLGAEDALRDIINTGEPQLKFDINPK